MNTEGNQSGESTLEDLVARLPDLAPCRDQIAAAYGALTDCFSSGGTLLVCGNGGSAADAQHIVGELMKAFRLPRPLSEATVAALSQIQDPGFDDLAQRLQAPLRAIALGCQTALVSAFSNDVDATLELAQEVLGYGRAGDALLCLSTSGNSRNVLAAAHVAKALGLRTIAMTGESGGRLGGLCDITIRVPASETAAVQEYHLAVYHSLCAALENRFFG